MKYFIGVDIGGTKVAIAVVSETGKILKQNVIPTELTILPKEMIMKISNSIREILAQTEIVKNDIIGIGIGSPGPLDAKEGLIDRKSTRLNSSHVASSYAVFCLKKKNQTEISSLYRYSNR